MQVNIECSPSSAIAYCVLEAGETVRAETGALAMMSDGIHVSVDAGPGSVLKGIMRKELAHESFLMTRFRAEVHNAWVAVVPTEPGDITQVRIHANHSLRAVTGSILALSEGVEDDVRFAGVRNMAMREGAVLQRIHGDGIAVLHTNGGLQQFQVGDGESIIVDTGHLVAFTEGMKYEVGPLGGILKAKLSGEGIVARLSGPGKVFTQTRAQIRHIEGE